MKVKVDKNICIGCGTCVALCAAIFSLGEDDKAEAKEQDYSDEGLDAAIEYCPTHAIEVLEK